MRASDRIKNLATRCAESGATSARVTMRGPYADRLGVGMFYVVDVDVTFHPFGETEHPRHAFPLRSEFRCRTRSGMRATARRIVRAIVAAGVDPSRVVSSDPFHGDLDFTPFFLGAA